MGNAIRRSRMRREDYDGSFPIDSLFGDIHRILTPPTSLPTCLDELIDWAAAASIMVSYLQENDRGSPLCRRGGPKMIDGDGLRFVPRMMTLDGDTNVKELPTKWLEKAAILAQQVSGLRWRKKWSLLMFFRLLRLQIDVLLKLFLTLPLHVGDRFPNFFYVYTIATFKDCCRRRKPR